LGNNIVKALVLTTTFPRWEGDITPGFVYDLSYGLQKSGLEIVVLAPHYEGAPSTETIDGMKVYRFPYFYPKKLQRLCYEGGILPNLKESNLSKIQLPLLFASEFHHTLRLIQKEKVNLIHAHWIVPSGLIGAICKRMLNLPLITTVHAGDVFPLQKKYLKPMGKAALNNCDACTVNSNATKDAVLKISDIQNRLRVLPIGVNMKTFTKSSVQGRTKKPPPDGRYIILSLGRLVEKKGVTYLIEAMPMILEKLPHVKLIVAGEGSEGQRLKEQAKRLGLDAKVDFIGAVSNTELPKLYSNADLFVLPSIIDSWGDTEGLGVVLLEAMACRTPVIGSRVGGITDIIENGFNGLLSEQKNAQDLANKIVDLLSDEELRQRFADNGLRTVTDKFSWEVVVKQFAQLYERVARS